MADAASAQVREAIEALEKALAGVECTFRAPMDASSAGPALRTLVDALDANQVALDEQLFPAMAESVAGSDAVCIRAMQGTLSSLRHELNGYLLSIDMQPVGTTRLQELLRSGCTQYIAYQLEEVIPMAERMLVS